MTSISIIMESRVGLRLQFHVTLMQAYIDLLDASTYMYTPMYITEGAGEGAGEGDSGYGGL